MTARTFKRRAADDAESALEAAAARPVNGDKLEKLRKKAAEARDLQLEIESLEEQLSLKRKDLTKILGGGKERGELVELLENSGVPSITLDARGNSPGFVAKLSTFYAASIPKDEAEAKKAFALLTGKYDAGDLIKTQIVAAFGKGESGRADKLETAMQKQGVEYEKRTSVHSGTLTAFVRERFETGEPLPPKDLATLGAFVGKVVKLNQVKEK